MSQSTQCLGSVLPLTMFILTTIIIHMITTHSDESDAALSDGAQELLGHHEEAPQCAARSLNLRRRVQ